MKNLEVANAWAAGTPGKSGTLTTDGSVLRSYKLQIGYTRGDGTKVLLDYTASGKYVSQTTSTHVGLALRALPLDGVVLHPEDH